MKFIVLATVALSANAALIAAPSNQVSLSQRESLASKLSRVHFGDTNCPCIGFDNIEGETSVEIKDGNDDTVTVAYPADLGARCEAWDDDKHPSCKSDKPPKWCNQKWCYVDPCRCSIDVLPKIAVYVPDATYRAKPIFFSYATCGGKDMYSVGVPAVGSPGCRCIGFAGLPGTTEVTFADDKVVAYPASIGGECQDWDKGFHPECKGKDQPSWCKANWCYVDPCSCDLPDGAVPKISAYLPEATFTGKNLYYSYETCKDKDTWTKKGNPNACVNQDTKEKCGNNPRCAWAGERCLGTELVNHPLCVDDSAEKKEKEKSAAASSRALSLASLAALFAAAGRH